MFVDPVTPPGGNPVTEVPGERPRFPIIVVAPVFVTVEAPRTPNVLSKAGLQVTNVANQ
jgi:hypothetical protein